MDAILLEWRRREPPLRVSAMLASGLTRQALVNRLRSLSIEELAKLRLLTDRDNLVLVGPEAALPWVDGVVWLGHDGPVLCPTTLVPSVPTDLIVSAITRQTRARGLIVVTPTVVLMADRPTETASHTQLRQLDDVPGTFP